MAMITVCAPIHSLVTVKIGECTVQRGETLTVWLNRAELHRRAAIQIELRVTKDGVPEIFIVDDAPEGMVQSLADWTPMESRQ